MRGRVDARDKVSQNNTGVSIRVRETLNDVCSVKHRGDAAGEQSARRCVWSCMRNFVWWRWRNLNWILRRNTDHFMNLCFVAMSPHHLPLQLLTLRLRISANVYVHGWVRARHVIVCLAHAWGCYTEKCDCELFFCDITIVCHVKHTSYVTSNTLRWI